MSSAVDRVGRMYGKLSSAAELLRSPLLLAIRLYWGLGFFHAGLGKLMNLDRTTGFFRDLGIPAPGVNAMMAGTTECAGGLLLALGLGSRLVAIPLIVTMIVAYGTAHADAVRGLFSDPDAFVTADPFPFRLASLIVLAFGPGALSIDALIARIREKDGGRGGVAN